MEKIFGADLRSQIVAGKGLKGGWTRVAAIIRQIGAAISAAHDCGIYHRDLKPENIMLQSSPTSASQEQVKIIDFDIATVKDSYDEKTRTTLFIAGSFNYAAPEQLEQKPGRASDIYALAIIVYEMLTGKLPFASLNKLSGNQFEQLIEQVRVRKQGEIKRLRELNPLAPRIVEDLLLQALAYEPSLRPSRADRFMNMLADALLNSTDTAPTNIVEKNIGKANNQALAKKSQKVYLPIIIILTIFTLAGTFGWRALPARQSQFRSPDNAIAPPATLDCQLIYSLSLREMQSPDHYRDKVILAGEEIVFHTGDLIKLNIASTSDGYLYIISESPVTEHEKPKYRLLFPDAQESNLLMAGQQQTIPAGNDPGFQFTGAKGTEKIWLIYARQQQPELESLRELVNSSEMGAINSPQQVGELQLLLNGQNSVRPMRDEKRNLMVAQGQGRLILALLRLTHN
jgi:serine/threonine protein kinase